jgi:hypothetical protein
MGDQVILHVEGGMFLLSLSEAMQVAEILCACSRPGKKWQAGGVKDLRVMLPPDAQAATITPYTALLKLDHETNAKEVT